MINSTNPEEPFFFPTLPLKTNIWHQLTLLKNCLGLFFKDLSLQLFELQTRRSHSSLMIE